MDENARNKSHIPTVSWLSSTKVLLKIAKLRSDHRCFMVMHRVDIFRIPLQFAIFSQKMLIQVQSFETNEIHTIPRSTIKMQIEDRPMSDDHTLLASRIKLEVDHLIHRISLLSR